MSSTRQSERRRIGQILIFAVLFALLAFVSGACAANTYTVCPSGCNYTRIQDAINASQPGDTIIVRDGIYIENVEVNVANLTLRSEHGSAFTTVVAAVNTSDVFLVSANSVTITGFTVRNATDSACGIYLRSVHHCTVSGNNAPGNYHGIRLDYSSDNDLTGNTANSNSNDNLIYNNYFDNPINAYDDGTNIWNITQTSGTNVIGGSWLGGNYWSDYTGNDTDNDGLGDTP